MQYTEKFDVIVIGGGHAGTEAALAAARTRVSAWARFVSMSQEQAICVMATVTWVMLWPPDR